MTHNKPHECIGCPMERIGGQSLIKPEGFGTSGIIIIGEGPGDEENKDLLPFRPRAASGSKLEECFKLAESDLLTPVRRSMFKLWNLVGCQPPYNRLEGMYYEAGAIEHCRVHFDKIVTGSDNIILALGNLPLRYLTSASGIAKEKQSITHLRGYVFKSKYGLVIPSLHPSYIKRGNPNLTPLLVEDIKKAIRLSRGETNHRYGSSYIRSDYNTTPSLEHVASFYNHVKDNRGLILTYDIETPETGNVEEDERDELESNEIITIQFSYSMGMAINLPYRYPYIDWIDKIFKLPNVKANQNTWRFDNPRIRAKGHEIAGRVHDLMWMFKHWHPNLPRNLQSEVSLFDFPFPWKHLYQSKFEWYGCADVDADQYLIHKLPRLMKEGDVWRGYIDHIFNLNPILTYASQEVGIPVDNNKRLELRDKMVEKREEISSRVQKLVPNECKNIRPRRGKVKDGTLDYGYKREPKGVRDLRKAYEVATSRLGEGKVAKPFSKLVWEKLGLAELEFQVSDSDNKFKLVKRWCYYNEFNPGSADQTIKYIKWKRKELEASEIEDDRELSESYVVPTKLDVDKSTGDRVEKETTGRKELEEVYNDTGDEVLEAVTSYRSTNTIINNFIPNWEPKRDGRVHTTWGYKAASGQLDSRNPNILNISKHTENGQAFRRIIVAPDGYSFVEMDYKSFHVATMGFMANSKDYIRFSQIDPHSIFTSLIMPNEWGQPIDMRWSDKDILARCKEIKSRCKREVELDPQHGIDIRQAISKPTVLGNQLGLGPVKLWRQNRRFIHGVNHAKDLQSVLANYFPEVTQAKIDIMDQAHSDKYLRNEFGFGQWFFEVYVWRWSKRRGKFEKRNGTQAEQALAFAVQSPAFGIIKTNILEADRLGYCREYNFCNTIHDSTVWMIRSDRLDKFIEDVYPVFTRPCSMLVNESTGPEGLRVGVEVSMGKNLGSYDEVGNVDGMREVSI